MGVGSFWFEDSIISVPFHFANDLIGRKDVFFCSSPVLFLFSCFHVWGLVSVEVGVESDEEEVALSLGEGPASCLWPLISSILG
jgi:hypothetical protein